MVLKFERDNAAEQTEQDENASGKAKQESSKKKPAAKKRAAKDDGQDAAETSGRVRLLLRLNFSEHEKLSHQRWLDRIPAEEPFKSVKTETVRTGDPEFPAIAELFDSLD
jgi:hypothetical protein